MLNGHEANSGEERAKQVKKGIRAVALIEASKGAVALLVGLDLHKLAGRNLQAVFETLATHLHLNPGSHLPGVISRELGSFSSSSLTLVAFGALAYAVVRFVEAYGLWRELVWTEWFAIVSGAIYMPFELYEVLFRTSVLSIAALVINAAVVWYVYSVVRGNHTKRPG